MTKSTNKFCDICNTIILSNQKWSKGLKDKVVHDTCREQMRKEALAKLGIKEGG